MNGIPSNLQEINQPHVASGITVQTFFAPDTQSGLVYHVTLDFQAGALGLVTTMQIVEGAHGFRISATTASAVFAVDETPQVGANISVTGALQVDLDDLSIGHFIASPSTEVRTLETNAKTLNIIPTVAGLLRVEFF